MATFSIRYLRRFIFNHLHNSDYESPLSRLINFFLIILIVTNVLAVMLESVDSIYWAYKPFFDGFEFISIGLFSIEYLLRLWCVPEEHPEQKAWKTRLQWMMSGGAIIDLLAILPAYLNFIVPIDLRFLRILRLLRLLKLTRYFVSLQILLAVIEREKGSFQAVVFILLIMIVMAAGGIYVVENKAQPGVFSSIPQAMWWAVVTLTTVGYGDVTPITNIGKLLGAVITILGVGLAALPAGILATGLANELSLRNQRLVQEFRNMLLSNQIDYLHENEQIEKIRKKIGLGKEQTHDVIMQLIREKDLEEKEQSQASFRYCPHCGEKLPEG
ncbi:ion transporter [Acinetobacter ihumii]|uniref:ion transporter n=1 Tax=Acinetobacter ihumii TaxID=2483802 RepID=UPI0010304B6E|nr:ion transporter [Acinetobacter ihumii]